MSDNKNSKQSDCLSHICLLKEIKNSKQHLQLSLGRDLALHYSTQTPKESEHVMYFVINNDSGQN